MQTNTKQYRRLPIRWVYGGTGALIVLFLITFGTSAYSFVQLETNGSGFHWSSGGFSPISFIINERGSDDIPDRSEEAAIRLAFETWEDVDSSGISFSEDRSPSSRSRTDWQSNDSHICMFIEDSSVSYFNNNSGLIAVTPIDFNLATGQIEDADILFNGRDHQFSTDLSSGTYDVQNIATHEVGHFIGLDHTGAYGATMVPVAFFGETRLRSLEQDDIAGASVIYPTGATFGSISGRVKKSDGTAVQGGYITAVSSFGVVASGDLTDANGNYEIRGLPINDTYRVYVEPLDGPLYKDNLFSRSPDLGFGTTFLGGNRTPSSVFVGGGVVQVEDITVRSQTAKNVTSTNKPIVLPGETGATVFFSGQQLQSSDTVEVTGGDVEVVSVFGLSSGASVTLNVDANAAPGLRSVSFMDSSGNMTVLTGGLEIGQPAPAAESAFPTDGSTSGGTQVTISGNGFQIGADVVIGDEIAQVSSVSSTSIQVQTPAQTAGTKDIVVINPDGQETRLRDAFTYEGAPPPSNTGSGNGTGGSGGSSGTQNPPSGSSNGSSSGTQAPPIMGGGGGGGGGCVLTSRQTGVPAGLLLLLGAVTALVAYRRRRTLRS